MRLESLSSLFAWANERKVASAAMRAKMNEDHRKERRKKGSGAGGSETQTARAGRRPPRCAAKPRRDKVRLGWPSRSVLRHWLTQNISLDTPGG